MHIYTQLAFVIVQLVILLLSSYMKEIYFL